MRVLITGANGFIGRNLRFSLSQCSGIETVSFTRESSLSSLPQLILGVDCVIHLAGVNRPDNVEQFSVDNVSLTESLCKVIAESKHKLRVIFASSMQASLENPYGESKLASEREVFGLCKNPNISVHVFRLPNVFGKWCKPNYNSVVATFCYNIARGLPIEIRNPDALLRLVYIDDVVEAVVGLVRGGASAVSAGEFEGVNNEYTATVGSLAELIRSFHEGRNKLMIERVGCGLMRALYSTYVSYIPVQSFSFTIKQHADIRGQFVEMLKTQDSGQFSYFTAYPGVTRGGHYHHTKTEKFLVVKGSAHFRFKNMDTGETAEVFTSGDRAEIVQTIPGWSHDITNVGVDEMIVMLWANEVFDSERPDTYPFSLEGGK